MKYVLLGFTKLAPVFSRARVREDRSFASAARLRPESQMKLTLTSEDGFSLSLAEGSVTPTCTPALTGPKVGP